MTESPVPAASRQDAPRGVAAALGAFGMWGLLPLYWKALGALPAYEQVSHRLLWTAAALIPIVILTGKTPALRAALAERKLVVGLLCSTVCIGVNWSLFIWGISRSMVLETSLGYYMNPLVNALLGCLVLRERFSRPQWLGILLACVGVFWSVAGHGNLPWLSLALAMTFALYGLARKVAPVDPACCVLAETLLMSPIAAAVLIRAYADGPRPDIAFLPVLMLSGPFTLLPMLAFNYAAQRVRLTVLGLTQYLSPTLSFFLGVFVFHEPFDLRRLITFAWIWAGVLVFSWASWRLMRRPGGQPRKRGWQSRRRTA